MRYGKLVVPLTLLGLVTTAASTLGQDVPFTVRIALVSQWVVDRHRSAGALGVRRPMIPQFRAALEGGVVDRAVFAWQRGVIQRNSLVWKPIRVLAGPESSAIGGRGEFRLLAVRPPQGTAAWTEVDVTALTGRSEDVLVLEVGGELNSIRQVLETIFVIAPGGPPVELGLARRALIPSEGVPVIKAPFGQPVVAPGGPAILRGAAGAEFLVARSPVETTPDGGITTNGLADLSSGEAGEWREGDRVFIRVALAAARARAAPDVVLGWKDRIVRPDRDGEFILPR
ncbi:MAG: hypothetical protein HY002_01580 [Candidatus Rokubacteria bacterium]|nr:hypothetical protein [Candidatus Rokubacteria bacterium]